MPIRFRCAYCTQLMSIARRKAGSVVRCPKCAGEIIVPAPEAGAASEGAFDQEDFDVKLEPDGGGPSTLATPHAGPQPLVDVPVPAAPPQRGLGFFVPLGMLIISGIVVILLLILMFVIGLIIGRQSALPG